MRLPRRCDFSTCSGGITSTSETPAYSSFKSSFTILARFRGEQRKCDLEMDDRMATRTRGFTNDRDETTISNIVVDAMTLGGESGTTTTTNRSQNNNIRFPCAVATLA